MSMNAVSMRTARLAGMAEGSRKEAKSYRSRRRAAYCVFAACCVLNSTAHSTYRAAGTQQVARTKHAARSTQYSLLDSPERRRRRRTRDESSHGNDGEHIRNHLHELTRNPLHPLKLNLKRLRGREEE